MDAEMFFVFLSRRINFSGTLKQVKILVKQIASRTFAAKFNIFKFYINNICQGN